MKDKTSKQTTGSVATPFFSKSTKLSCSVMYSVLNLMFRCRVFLDTDSSFYGIWTVLTLPCAVTLIYDTCACDSTKTGENVGQKSTG